MRTVSERVAYTTNLEGGMWEVVICVENEKGYRPVHDYGPYEKEERAEMIAKNLNKRLGISDEDVMHIVGSTMPKRKRRNVGSSSPPQEERAARVFAYHAGVSHARARLPLSPYPHPDQEIQTEYERGYRDERGRRVGHHPAKVKTK